MSRARTPCASSAPASAELTPALERVIVELARAQARADYRAAKAKRESVRA